MKRAEIQTETTLNIVEQIRVQHHTEGAKKMFDAAAFVGDGQATAKYREELHALLDRALDTQASLMALSRKMIEAQD